MADTIESLRSEGDGTPTIGQAFQRMFADTEDDQGEGEEEEDQADSDYEG